MQRVHAGKPFVGGFPAARSADRRLTTTRAIRPALKVPSGRRRIRAVQEAIAARVIHSQRRLHLNFIIREYMDT